MISRPVWLELWRRRRFARLRCPSPAAILEVRRRKRPDRRPAHSLRPATQPMRGAAGRLQLLRVSRRRIKRANAAVALPSAAD